MLQSIRLMFKNVNHIYKYTAISNNTICLLYVINKRVAQLVFKIILRCEKLAWYTNLWITDFRTVVLSQNISFLNTTNLKVPLRRKIVGPILNASEQHFHTNLNGVFSFSVSCFVLEILRFFETCKLAVSDVIYSRIINYIYQMVNISINRRQKFFKLCMTIAIW